jgi:hypothetical protein
MGNQNSSYLNRFRRGGQRYQNQGYPNQGYLNPQMVDQQQMMMQKYDSLMLGMPAIEVL